MKEIKLAVSELKEALPGLTKIICRGRALPVLQSIRINRNREGVVTLHATDLDSFLTYSTTGVQEGEPSEVLVPIEQLAKAIKCSAPKADIGILPESTDKAKIRYNIAGNTVEQTINTLPAVEFPAAPLIRQPGVELEPQFGKALKEALACCSEDASRAVLRGACVDVSDKKFHYIVGTNGRSLFSANSFCFAILKSVIIPDSKFLTWSDFLDEQPAFMSVEPGKEAQEAKNGQPAQAEEPGWVKLESPRWTFVTREIEGTYPNWKQCVPSTNGKWTQVILSDEAIRQLVLVIPNLPGADDPNCMIRLRVDQFLTVEGQTRDGQWTSVPVQSVTVQGSPVAIALNREYLLKALRFGLNKLEIEDELTPMVITKGGKRMVIMPVRMGADKPEAAPSGSPTPATEVTAAPTPSTPSTPPAAQGTPSEQPQPPTKEATTEERKPVSKATKAPETTKSETPAETNPGSAVKSLAEQVESIKETLRGVIREVSTAVDTIRTVEKEKRATEKEIDAIRTKLRQIQNVTI